VSNQTYKNWELQLMYDDSLYEGLRRVCEQPSMISDWKERLKDTKDLFFYLEANTTISEFISIKRQ